MFTAHAVQLRAPASGQLFRAVYMPVADPGADDEFAYADAENELRPSGQC
jgi:hypothetical protein